MSAPAATGPGAAGAGPQPGRGDAGEGADGLRDAGKDTGGPRDAGEHGGGLRDAGEHGGGPRDVGEHTGGPRDVGEHTGGPRDVGEHGGGFRAAAEGVGGACTGADAACEAAAAAAPPDDLTWLLHRAAQRMRVVLDQVARGCGLADGRDWIVLSALLAEPGRTQLALAHDLGLDKTTLTTLLDRLEATGLVLRNVDPHDRRARIPAATAAGAQAQAAVTRARDRAEAEMLAAFSPAEQQELRALLARLAAGHPGECLPSGGSCM